MAQTRTLQYRSDCPRLAAGLNGRQVADAARTTCEKLKVLFITGFAENAAIGDGLLGPGIEVMTKPLSFAMPSNRARRMLER